MLLSLLLLPGAAGGHDAPSGWSYPLACCNGAETDGDCQRIPSKTVRERKGGWLVTLRPGDHTRVTRPHLYFIPYGAEIESRDGEYHICLYPTEDHENCFFAPHGSM